MEDSQVDIPATQALPPSVISEVSVTKQSRNMSSNERAECSTMNESPAIVFNTGVSTFVKKPDVDLFDWGTRGTSSFTT